MNVKTLPCPPFEVASPIEVDEYQRRAIKTDTTSLSGNAKLEFPYLGLFGEVGTLLSALKKKQRDGSAYIGYETIVYEEFGDVLWYLANIASRSGITLSTITSGVFRAAAQNASYPHFGCTYKGTPLSESEFESALIGLGAEVGKLFIELQEPSSVTEPPKLIPILTGVFAALVKAAEASGINLNDAAIDNLKKIYDYLPPEKKRTPLFDADELHLEQLPRRIEMVIFERERDGRQVMYQQCNGVNIGKTLTDNKINPDGYRFHDVFHLAYAAILGWSPTMRALLKVKRKAKPRVDEAEDGQRAGFLEEGISALIFQHAVGVNGFKGLQKVDYSLLKLVRSLANGYEVEACALWEWEEAILEGFKVFYKLLSCGRGTIVADLNQRTISFEEISEQESLRLGISSYRKI